MTFCKTVWLIGDDGPGKLMTEKLILLSQFAETVVSFAAVSEALSLLKKAEDNQDIVFPNIIFLDLNMAEMSGWDFLKAYLLLSEGKRAGCELYMLSSSADAEEFLNAREYHEVCDFISKPLLQNDLEEIMNGFRLMGNDQGKASVL